jgi:serine/threonine-protein kinase
MLVQHARETPVPPSVRSELPVPGSLDALILSCLEKSRDARPRSAAELGARLEEIEREIGEWTQDRAARWWTAHLPQLVRGRAPAPTGTISTVAP